MIFVEVRYEICYYASLNVNTPGILLGAILTSLF